MLRRRTAITVLSRLLRSLARRGPAWSGMRTPSGSPTCFAWKSRNGKPCVTDRFVVKADTASDLSAESGLPQTT